VTERNLRILPTVVPADGNMVDVSCIATWLKDQPVVHARLTRVEASSLAIALIQALREGERGRFIHD